ncbi:MAG: HlyD family efflux transporter periplasmic adaptor subunit [Acidobacteriota bacterium]
MRVLGFLCLLGGAMLSACSNAPEAPVHVGYVEAEWVYVASPQSGWLTARQVSEGDDVEAGRVLFELDKARQQAALAEADGRISQAGAELRDASTGARPAELRVLEAQLAEAEARLAQAISERDRVLPLVENGIEARDRRIEVIAEANSAEAAVAAARENIGVARLAARSGVREAAQAGVATAEAQRVSAEVDLRERTVVARTGGRVEDVFHHPGEFVTAGSPVLALLPDDGLKIKFFVSQGELPQLALGKTVRATADGRAEGVEAVVSFIAGDAEFTPPVIYSRDARAKLVFLVEATLPAGSGLRPGLPVDVEWS